MCVLLVYPVVSGVTSILFGMNFSCDNEYVNVNISMVCSMTV